MGCQVVTSLKWAMGSENVAPQNSRAGSPSWENLTAQVYLVPSGVAALIEPAPTSQSSQAVPLQSVQYWGFIGVKV